LPDGDSEKAVITLKPFVQDNFRCFSGLCPVSVYGVGKCGGVGGL
jgi:hypothetical protein